MNCVGIDISKGKSMIAVMRPFGEVVVSPFEVLHTDSELRKLARLLKSLDGETRVVMESTGNYHAPVAWLLHGAGLYVSVVNAMLVHDYGNNSLRRGKTDKKDAVKLANYGLDHWLTLPRYVPEEDARLMLKTCYRQYQQYSKVQTMLKNNLISLLDTAFPDANRLFTSPPRADGSEKWVDFVAAFWHCECVCGLSKKAFTTKYQKWCRKHGYNFSEDKALDIYVSACGRFGVMPKTKTAKLLVEQAISQLLCLRLWTLRCHAENKDGKTFGRTGHFPTPGNFRRISCSQTGDAVSGSFSAGVSCSDGDVWCWPHTRPPTHS